MTRRSCTILCALLLSVLVERGALAGGWILGEGANLNGRPLADVMRGFGDRLIWSFDDGSDDGHSVSSVDLIMGGSTVDTAPDALRRDLEELRLTHSLDRARFVTLWVTPQWNTSWFGPRLVQAALDAGVTPVFLDWYFGDDLLTGDPRVDVPPRLDDYADHSRRLGRFLGQFDGDILVVVEPELNKPAIERWPDFGQIIRSHGIEEIRRGVREINEATGRSTTVFYGVALTDNGLRRADQPDDVYGTKAYGDSYGWTLSRPLLEVLRPDLDFVGFQQIIAQFHRDPENPERPVSNSPEDIGLRQVPERMVNYARYLHKQLGIPVFVPYLGMPTATWTDSDGSGRIERGEIDGDGWVEEVGRVLSRLHDLEADMRAAGVIGQGTMMLFDDPVHDLGGYQYLLQNEYALGLVATGARDGVPGERFGPEIASKWFRDRSFVELFFGE